MRLRHFLPKLDKNVQNIVFFFKIKKILDLNFFIFLSIPRTKTLVDHKTDINEEVIVREGFRQVVIMVAIEEVEILEGDSMVDHKESNNKDLIIIDRMPNLV